MPASYIIHMSGYSRYIFNDPSIHPCFKLKIIGFRMPLISYLCCQIRSFPGCCHQQFSFMESTAQRFFHINMFSFCQCQHRNREMSMIGNSNGYSIELVSCFVEHLTKIAKLFCFRIHALHLLCLFSVKVNIT